MNPAARVHFLSLHPQKRNTKYANYVKDCWLSQILYYQAKTLSLTLETRQLARKGGACVSVLKSVRSQEERIDHARVFVKV